MSGRGGKQGGGATGGTESSSPSTDGPPKGASAAGGAAINGTIESMLTPELLFRMNKKIAQLTKVVYGLNTRGEELEAQIATIKESEETLKVANNELQTKVTYFKNKCDVDIGNLRELEAQASQAQYWKMECENLKRRLDLEGGLGMMGGDARGAISAARDDADRALRREKAVTYELEQARQAITNLKGHHDFIMRERDAQMVMEREKQELEWQTRMADLENRYKAQIRRANDEMEVITAECEILRRRIQDNSGSDSQLRQQMDGMHRDHDRQRRELELKVQMVEQDMQELNMKLSQEKREYEQKLRNVEEEKRLAEEDWEDRLREQIRNSESRLREAQDKRELMQRLIDDKEDEFEARLKAKVVEWKTEWDAVEEGLKDEIKKLKEDNNTLKTDSNLYRSRLDRSGIEYEMKVQELEEALEDKEKGSENQIRILKERLSSTEGANRETNMEKNTAERKLREEKEKNRQLEIKLEVVQRVKEDLESKSRQMSDAERELKAEVMTYSSENETLKAEKEELEQELEDKEAEWTAKIEEEGRNMEYKTKMRVERTWLDKLKRSEASAAQDMERLKENHKRIENDLKKELSLAQKGEEETKRLNEEFKKKVKTLRQTETDMKQKLTTLQDKMEAIERKEDPKGIQRKELASQEERYQKQVDQLTLSLAQKQEDVKKLTSTIEELKGAKDTLKDSEELQTRLENLQKEIRDKTAALDGVKGELQTSKDEVQIHKAKLKKLEDDLEAAKQKNISLQNQVTATSNCGKQDIDSRISSLEDRLKVMQAEKEKLEKTIEEIEQERDEEIKIIQDALEEAAQEREDLINTFEKEVQEMTTISQNREQKLMEDFEWKLREIEKEHKKKLDEKDRITENTMHRHKRHNDDTVEEVYQKQEKLKNQLNAEWEDKLRTECSRLKSELDNLHAEEKHLAVESMKVQKEQELRALKQSWELKKGEMTKEISRLKDSLTDKDSYYHKEMENMRTTSDRDIWDLRRKLQRLDDKASTEKENLVEKHNEDMERMRQDYKEQIAELEKKMETRPKYHSYDDLKRQLEKIHNDEMEYVCEQHRESMERLREELEAERYTALEEARVIVSQHMEHINTSLKEQLVEVTCASNQYRDELEAVRTALALREEVIGSLQEELTKVKSKDGENASALQASSQYSIAYSEDSNGSNHSQDRLSFSESVDTTDEAQKSGSSGLLGKVFGGGWFGSSKGKENSRRGSSIDKKMSPSS